MQPSLSGTTPKKQVGPHIVLIPSCFIRWNGNYPAFDRKFFDGMALYCEYWPGPVTCLIRVDESAPADFGLVSLPPDQLPFRCVVLEKRTRIGPQHLRSADLILASADMPDQLHISWLCRALGKKCVYGIEYTMETRKQIVALAGKSWPGRVNQNLHIFMNELFRRCALTLVDGLQANGHPAYDEYAYVPNRLLYFDTRVGHDVLIDDAALAEKQARVEKGDPLHLAFSGRLIKMKGADDLIQIARGLKAVGTPFKLTIYGAGEEASSIRDGIAHFGLGQEVDLRGAVDFYETLVPEVQRSVDLYILPHKQGDPSCTYFETLACGVPIVGYTNRAFAGILADAEVGWGVPMNDVHGVVETVTRLHRDRRLISAAAARGLALARKHDFETTFYRRISQLADLVGVTPNVPPRKERDESSRTR